jgi:hypothetical protein
MLYLVAEVLVGDCRVIGAGDPLEHRYRRRCPGLQGRGELHT